MRKQFFSAITLCIIFMACREDAADGIHTIAARNFEINASNAYNPLFLDSTNMEEFIIEQELNDSTANGIRSFYNIRNYQFAWFQPNGLTEQALAFRNLYDYTNDSAKRKWLDETLDQLSERSSFKVSASSQQYRKVEWMLTWRYINFLESQGHHNWSNSITQQFPIYKYTIEELVNEELQQKISHPAYQSLQKALQHYHANAEKHEELPSIEKPVRHGQSHAIIPQLKKQLAIFYGYSASDTSDVVNDSLTAAVKLIQASYGYTENNITPQLIKELNTSPSQRLEQILINLERMKWLPENNKGKHIIVNIPAFTLIAQNNGDPALQMNVVVGKEGSSTVMFTGNLNQIVFSPYWNVPASIVKNEILPKLENDPEYLAKQQMEQTGERNGLPVIRQLPGNHNALGKVKFLFPNSYNIYLHDTPNKNAFRQDQRAMSHGCIRVEHPTALAEWILSDKSAWNEKTITAAMDADKEKWVKVSPPVPVLIYYLTCWADDQGVIQFRKDIYGHDEKMKELLFYQ